MFECRIIEPGALAEHTVQEQVSTPSQIGAFLEYCVVLSHTSTTPEQLHDEERTKFPRHTVNLGM